ncbi:RNA polymerase sigma factor [Treponema phagedenis]|nr:RNA polymerase sigma factor [Treponema phagedenis]TYT77966.1 RNA polymerase sigma factor [Treponema phagedenis]
MRKFYGKETNVLKKKILSNNDPKKEQQTQKKIDKEICKAVLNGNTQAFSVLVEKYQQQIYRLGMSFFKNEDDSKDFVQDVMLKAYTALGSFRGDSAFSTWLISIAYNTAINSMRRSQRFVSFAESFEIEAPGETPEERHINNCMKLSIREAVENLCEKYRVCIDLYFFYDMPYADISSITGLPVNTIKSHVFRAKKILREYLTEEQVLFRSNENPSSGIFAIFQLRYDL